MLLLQFVVNEVLDDVLQDGRPARHLVGVLRDALLAWHSVRLALTLRKRGGGLGVRVQRWICTGARDTERSFSFSTIPYLTLSYPILPSLPHLRNDINAEHVEVLNGLLLLGLYLGVLHQLLEVVRRDAVLGEDVEQDDAQLVLVLDSLIQQDGDDRLHVLLDLLSWNYYRYFIKVYIYIAISTPLFCTVLPIRRHYCSLFGVLYCQAKSDYKTPP